MSIHVDFSDLTHGMDRIAKKKTEAILREVERSLIDGALAIEADAVHLAPEHDGELIQSIAHKKDHISATHLRYFIYASADHALSVEFGSKPHWTSARNLKKWAGDKLGDENLAYAVQKSIARKGTKAQPFLRPAFYRNDAKIEQDIKNAVKRGLRK